MQKKRHWFWNFLIVFTVIVCIFAFTAHYKNWVKVEQDHIKILSGIYYEKIDIATIKQVEMVDKIPAMNRINGFSALTKEKGVFRDSLVDAKVYVYIDDLTHPKIKLVHHDSLQLFLNFSDSVKTRQLFDYLSLKVEENRSNITQ
ncbi:hypothetical protein [Costertonia aggregata]|uniref:Uncharacterized protein n=1 Tax=Costertonia aggregata TaxID=343403 RepID=A0A7H9ANT8_9FLAO|nr:hypothetical protein [Costertonia aggregata]QLG45098.1 hypothetical protein HYG79_06950 [Costertonia aggregata]